MLTAVAQLIPQLCFLFALACLTALGGSLSSSLSSTRCLTTTSSHHHHSWLAAQAASCSSQHIWAPFEHLTLRVGWYFTRSYCYWHPKCTAPPDWRTHIFDRTALEAQAPENSPNFQLVLHRIWSVLRYCLDLGLAVRTFLLWRAALTASTSSLNYRQ